MRHAVGEPRMLGPVLSDSKAKGIADFMMGYNRSGSNHRGPFGSHAANFRTICERPDTGLEGEHALYR